MVGRRSRPGAPRCARPAGWPNASTCRKPARWGPNVANWLAIREELGAGVSGDHQNSKSFNDGLAAPSVRRSFNRDDAELDGVLRVLGEIEILPALNYLLKHP